MLEHCRSERSIRVALEEYYRRIDEYLRGTYKGSEECGSLEEHFQSIEVRLKED